VRIAFFCHSIRSDWNHGNAHFLRGVATELIERGHDVHLWEPAGSWSATNLALDHGDDALHHFRSAYPALHPTVYDGQALDLEQALDGVDLCIVHEWNDHDLVRAVGRYRSRSRRLRVLFHDTHHRSVTDPASMSKYDLSHYDGVLAFGAVIQDIYIRKGWASRAFVWHEAADTRVFRPRPAPAEEGDVVWIGNWGDEERSAELHDFFLRPVRELGLRARVHGVRYPASALQALTDAAIPFGGWLANHRVPDVFARFRFTVHVPRRPYAAQLPGIPTIRPFEALACGIALVSAPWDDREGLFSPGSDYLVARDGDEMKRHMRVLQHDAAARRALADHGLATILARHTCAHRVDDLLRFAAAVGTGVEPRLQHQEGTLS
jgi:spore maturation protein CgeB